MGENKLRNVASMLFFSIAVIKECNYKCGYCYPFGQNKSIGSNMSREEFSSLIAVANESGFSKFKITGGEPTLVNWLFDAIDTLLNVYPDINFVVITNGKNLLKYINILKTHKSRISIQFSLDSVLDKPKTGIYKVLDKNTENVLSELSRSGIKTRINMVVSKQNQKEVNDMIKLAARFGFSLKLFNLFIQKEYIATNGVNGSIGRYSTLTPQEYWKEEYVAPNNILESIKHTYAVERVNETHEEGFGSVQSVIKVADTKIMLLNSSEGAFFNRQICINSCPLFGKTCEKGLFNPLVSSNMVLHIDDCNNTDYRWDLRGKDRGNMRDSINAILKLFLDIEFVDSPIPTPPKINTKN